jgi:hypothetical protein
VNPAQVSAVAFSPDGRALATGSNNGKARVFPVAPEWPDDLAAAAARVESLTGMTLDAGQGSVRVLDNAEWRARRDRVRRLNPSARSPATP